MPRQDRPDRAGDLGQVLMAVVLTPDAGDLGLRDHRELGLGSRQGCLKGSACILRPAPLVQADQLRQHMFVGTTVECGTQQAQRGDRGGRAPTGQPNGGG